MAPHDEKVDSHAITRRGFLGGALALSLSSALGRDASAAPGRHDGYQVVGWAGDAFDLPHRLRDGWRPAEPRTWSKREVVVVGAGIAGLSAAFRLQQTDLLVLELAQDIGGNARSARYKRWEFNIGSAYFVDVDGEAGQMWADLGLKPVAITAPTDRWYLHGRWIDDPWRDESIATLPPATREAMRGAKRAFKQIIKSKDFPHNPYTTATAKALQLDRISFAEWLKPHAHPDVLALINSYCYSALGAPASVISAYGGINFYSDVIEECAYAYNEGNAVLAKAMAAHVDRAGTGRIHTGCAVHRIVPVRDDLARVYYTRQGESFGVEAKRVVLAMPYFVAARAIEGLAPSQRYALGCQSYCCYVVANLCFDRVVSAQAYDNWVPNAGQWDDYLPVGWADKEAEKPRAAEGQVLGVFACQRRPVLARWRLLVQRPEHFARPIVDAFAKVHPGTIANLRQVHMSRWGHAFIINRPGMYTRWLPNLRKRIGPIVLAHGDGMGLPAIESSRPEGEAAARIVLRDWRRSK
jgi:protoporphyrinogen oxidase